MARRFEIGALELRTLPGIGAVKVEDFVCHPLHRGERIWSETNCYVDLWIELLHLLGVEPITGLAFTLSTDFDIDQWDFFKFPPEDLRVLYGIEVAEMNLWKPLLDHVCEQMDSGRLVTVEVDAWYLPDTAGVSYRVDHTKTTIVPTFVDAVERSMKYLHNAGLYQLEGEDFDGVMRRGPTSTPEILVPYVEIVKVPGAVNGIVSGRDLSTPAEIPHSISSKLAREHINRRPRNEPVDRMRQRIDSDLRWLTGAGIDTFHRYAFGMFRQLGSSSELASSFCDWLAEQEGGSIQGGSSRGALVEASGQFMEVAKAAKSLQFQMSRVAAGRAVDPTVLIASIETAWQAASRSLDLWRDC